MASIAGLIGVLAGAAAFIAVKKLRNRLPPPAAREALERARASADTDSVPAFADAETQATAAIDAAPHGFPEAYAQLAEIEVAWADALNDEAFFWNDRAQRAGREGDDRNKQEADGKAATLQDQAKARLGQAFEAAIAGTRLDPKSKDAALALADYYRAAGSRTKMDVELKRAASLAANPARIALVQGTDLLAQGDGTGPALEKLRAATSALPGSARAHFRLAMAYLIAQKTGEAQQELQETLRLSPGHQRAMLALDTLSGRAETKPEAKPETRTGKRPETRDGKKR